MSFYNYFVIKRSLNNTLYWKFSRNYEQHSKTRKELKVRLSPSTKNLFIYFNDSPSVMMKNFFHFMLKAPSVLKIFNFLSLLFSHIKKIRSFWRHKLVKKAITIHILLNISWIKGNQTMEFGQLIEYIKRNIFFKNHAEMRLGDKFQTSFCFFKKLYLR